MVKQRDFRCEKIDLCRNCGGGGRTTSPGDGSPEACPVCGGTGRVRKTVIGRVEIEPYSEGVKP